jgi:hypothetical protein
MAAKLTRLTYKIAIQLHLVAESCTICSSLSRRPVRKLLDTLSYLVPAYVTRLSFVSAMSGEADDVGDVSNRVNGTGGEWLLLYSGRCKLVQG